MDKISFTQVNDIEAFAVDLLEKRGYSKAELKNVNDEDIEDVVRASNRTSLFEHGSFQGKVSVKVLNRIIPLSISHNWSLEREKREENPYTVNLSDEDKRFLTDISFDLSSLDSFSRKFKEMVEEKFRALNLIIAENRGKRYDRFWFNLYLKDKSWMKNYGFDSFKPSMTRDQFVNGEERWGNDYPSVEVKKDGYDLRISFDSSSQRPYGFSNYDHERKTFSKIESLFKAVQEDLETRASRDKSKKENEEQKNKQTSEFTSFCKDELGVKINLDTEWHSYGGFRRRGAGGYSKNVFKFDLNKKNQGIKISPRYAYKGDDNHQTLDRTQVSIGRIEMPIKIAKKFIEMMKEVDE